MSVCLFVLCPIFKVLYCNVESKIAITKKILAIYVCVVFIKKSGGSRISERGVQGASAASDGKGGLAGHLQKKNYSYTLNYQFPAIFHPLCNNFNVTVSHYGHLISII